MLRLINFRQSEPTNAAFIRLSGHLAAITEDLAPRAIFIWYFRKTDGRGGGGGGGGGGGMWASSLLPAKILI